MSRQLTISSLFSTLALVVLALFARAGDLTGDSAASPVGPASFVQVQSLDDAA